MKVNQVFLYDNLFEMAKYIIECQLVSVLIGAPLYRGCCLEAKKIKLKMLYTLYTCTKCMYIMLYMYIGIY